MADKKGAFRALLGPASRPPNADNKHQTTFSSENIVFPAQNFLPLDVLLPHAKRDHRQGGLGGVFFTLFSPLGVKTAQYEWKTLCFLTKNWRQSSSRMMLSVSGDTRWRWCSKISADPWREPREELTHMGASPFRLVPMPGGGGGGHCLLEGRYPPPNYRPRFSGLSALSFL